MAFAERNDTQDREKELLALAHETELCVLSQQYADELHAFTVDYTREVSALRERWARALARIVANFERRRAASAARLQVGREVAGSSRGISNLVGKA